jgi:hypothetical protein
MPTRRTLISAAFAPLANSRSGIRLEPHGNPQRPAIAAYLPNAATPSIRIELPEHASSRAHPDSEPVWFYKLYGSSPQLTPRVTWANTANALQATLECPTGFTLTATTTNEDDGIAINYRITAPTPVYAMIEAVTCVKLYRPFTDVFLERTFTHCATGLEPIAADTPERLTKNAEEWLPARYIARVSDSAPPQPYRHERQDNITRYFKSKPATHAILLTESNPPGWTVATYAQHCDSIFTNPARTCHHTDPQARNITNGQATLDLKVFILPTTPALAWRQIKRRTSPPPPSSPTMDKRAWPTSRTSRKPHKSPSHPYL